MSDSDEDMYGSGGDESGSGYDYDSGSDADPDDDDPMVEVENQFVEAAEDLRTGNVDGAMAKFAAVIDGEAALGDDVKFSFPSVKNMVTCLIARGDFAAAKERYAQLLGMLSKVTANLANEAVNTVLEAMGAAGSSSTGSSGIAELYELTLEVTRESNPRLWFATLTKLAGMYLEAKDAAAARRAIEDLHAWCRGEDGEDDEAKGTQLMEVYALRIQLAGLTKDFSTLSSMDERVRALSASAIVDPRITGIVKEASASKCMADQDWTGAYEEFRAAFTSFQAAGNPRAVECLRYTLLANLLSGMRVDPFDSPEAKAYQHEPLITAMVRLRQAFDRDDMATFHEVMRDPESHILDDEFMRGYIDPLFRSVRARVVLRRIKPYRTVRLSFLAEELKDSQESVEELLASLILDGRLQGTLDQVSGVLTLTAPSAAVQAKTFQALGDALNALERSHGAVCSRVVSVR